MLLEKSINAGDVVTLKLVGGEEIIARYDEETIDAIKVNRPLSVVAGARDLGMIPWVFLSSSDSVKINKTAIVAGPMLSKKEAATQYLEGTTGIALS